MSEKSLREIMRKASEEARVDIAKAVEAATAPLKLPADVEAAITALAETVTHKEIVVARSALVSAVLKYGDETRAERDAARAEVERLKEMAGYYERQHDERECPACNGGVTKATGYQCVDCDRWYHRECLRKHCAGELERVTVERDAAVALLEQVGLYENRYGERWTNASVPAAWREQRAALRAFKKQES